MFFISFLQTSGGVTGVRNEGMDLSFDSKDSRSGPPRYVNTDPSGGDNYRGKSNRAYDDDHNTSRTSLDRRFVGGVILCR